MRVIGRSIAGLALILAVVAAGFYLFRGMLVETALRAALERAGVEDPALKVSDVSFTRLRLTDVKGGGRTASPVDIAEVDVEFDFFRLLNQRSVQSISVGPGSVGIKIDDKGAISVAGFAIPLGPREQRPLPFDDLALKELAIAVTAPEGEARGKAAGAFSREDGGSFELAAATDAMGIGAWRASDASVSGTLGLASDGVLTTRLNVEGDFATPYGEARQTTLAISGEGRSWRDALDRKFDDLAGDASVDLRITDVPASSSRFLSAIARPAGGGQPITTFAATGGLRAELAGGRLSVSALDGTPLRIEADRGDVFVLTALDGAPLYEQAGASRRAAVAASLSGKALSGEATARAAADAGSLWTFEASADLAEQAIAAFELGKTSLAASGTATAKLVDAVMTLSTRVEHAAAGAIRLSKAPLQAALTVRADIDAKSLTVATEGDRCIELERAEILVDGQDSDARLSDARLCGAAEPLLVSSWGESPGTTLNGRLAARQARYRVGRTLFEGAPPMIDFRAVYDSDSKSTTAAGALSGGRVVLNNAIIASSAEGSFSARVGGGAMSGEARLATVRLTQNADPVWVSPVAATGSARLAERRISFDYTAATPAGTALGRGAGAHDINTGRGETRFQSGSLRFAPGGLQPAGIAPGLLGIIGSTRGVAAADLRFTWGPRLSDASTSANLELRGLSFRGPGVAVSETRDVNGTIELTSFAPLKSGGLQTLQIGSIDLNALKLEKGILDFELPGDETLHVIDTEFPWFGGKLGIYDARASLTGEKANVPLRAEKVDLAQILAFVNIEGLSGEGILSGSLPLVVNEGKASIVNGELRSDGPGAIRYVGKAAEAAASANPQSKLAFSILRDLRFTSLKVTMSGPLDGRIDFKCEFEGTGEVPYGETSSRLPVQYNISIDAPLLDLLNQANLTRDVGRQIQLGVEGEQ